MKRQTWLCWEKLVFTPRPADLRLPLLLHTKLPQPRHVLWLSYGCLQQNDGLAVTLSQGDRPESRADAPFPTLSASVPVCSDAICSATPENLPPLCASAMTRFLCIPKGIQMLTFQHWKKRKVKMLIPLHSKRQALHLWMIPSKGQWMNYFVWPSHSELKTKKSFGICESWRSLKDVKLEGPAAEFYLSTKQKHSQCLNSDRRDHHFGKQWKKPCIRYPRLPTKLCLEAKCFLFLHIPLEINDHSHTLWAMKGD